MKQNENMSLKTPKIWDINPEVLVWIYQIMSLAKTPHLVKRGLRVGRNVIRRKGECNGLSCYTETV